MKYTRPHRKLIRFVFYSIPISFSTPSKTHNLSICIDVVAIRRKYKYLTQAILSWEEKKTLGLNSHSVVMETRHVMVCILTGLCG